MIIRERPNCPHGFRNASRDSGIITELWRRWPGPLVGIATGRHSGVDVVDLDPRNGAAFWWAQHRLRIPKTRVHRSISDGLHLFFRYKEGKRLDAMGQGRGPFLRPVQTSQLLAKGLNDSMLGRFTRRLVAPGAFDADAKVPRGRLPRSWATAMSGKCRFGMRSMARSSASER